MQRHDENRLEAFGASENVRANRRSRAYRAPRLVRLGKARDLVRGSYSSGYDDKYGDKYHA